MLQKLVLSGGEGWGGAGQRKPLNLSVHQQVLMHAGVVFNDSQNCQLSPQKKRKEKHRLTYEHTYLKNEPGGGTSVKGGNYIFQVKPVPDFQCLRTKTINTLFAQRSPSEMSTPGPMNQPPAAFTESERCFPSRTAGWEDSARNNMSMRDVGCCEEHTNEALKTHTPPHAGASVPCKPHRHTLCTAPLPPPAPSQVTGCNEHILT